MTEQNTPKKKSSILTKIILLIALTICGIAAAKMWSKKSEQKQEQAGSESDILGVTEEYSDQNAQDDLSDLTVNELREKGAEFIYQMLIKNQLKIEDLQTQINGLKGEVLKYRNQEKLGKMTLVYVELREKILNGKTYNEELKSFDVLSSSDEVITTKLTKLKPLLASFSTQKKLEKSFSDLIPELILNKKNGAKDEKLFDKIRRNISRLVVIRRIDEKHPEEVDAIIVRIEKLLKQENYQDALSAALSLPQDDHEILKNFLDELNASIEVRQIDQEILNYLKSLS